MRDQAREISWASEAGPGLNFIQRVMGGSGGGHHWKLAPNQCVAKVEPREAC